MIKRVTFALAIAIIVFIVAILVSCNPEKRLQRKEDKALGVVEGSRRVFPIAGADWLAIHPCVITHPRPDSIVTRVDTFLAEKKVFVPFKVTELKDKVIDTIINGISLYVTADGIVLKNLNDAVVKTNTVYRTIIDQTLVSNQLDTIQSLRVQKGNLAGQIIANDIANKQQHDSDTKEKTKWIIWFMVLAAISVISHVARSYVKI